MKQIGFDKTTYKVFSVGAEIIDNEIWLASCIVNRLMKIDIDTGMVEIVCELPESSKGNFGFSDIYQYKGKIYMVPMGANAIWIYDIQKKQYASIELKLTEKEKLFIQKNRKSLFIGKVLYLFGYDLNYIVSYNVESKELTYIWNKKTPLKITDAAIYGKDIICTSEDDNELIIFDTENGKIKTVVVDVNAGVGFGTIAVLGKYAYLSNYFDEEVIWNIETNKVEQIVPLRQLQKQEGGYGKCILIQNGRLYFPMFESNIVAIVDGKVIRICENEAMMNMVPYGLWKFGLFVSYKSGFFFLDRLGQMFYFDLNQSSIWQKKIMLNETDRRELYKQMEWDAINYETYEKTLMEFVEFQMFKDL